MYYLYIYIFLFFLLLLPPGLNEYVTDELAFEFHYFFTRKFWMLYHCQALVVAPGGFGTLDELFEVRPLFKKEAKGDRCLFSYKCRFGRNRYDFPYVFFQKAFLESLPPRDRMGAFLLYTLCALPLGREPLCVIIVICVNRLHIYIYITRKDKARTARRYSWLSVPLN